MNKSNVDELKKGGLFLYVYVEYLILENAIINYIILYVTKKISRTDTTKLRMLLSAVISSLYTLVFFFPSLHFMTKFSIKISISILIIILAFNPEKLGTFLKLITIFYVTSFLFAGASLGLFYFSKSDSGISNGNFYIVDFPVEILVLAVVISTVLAKYFINFIQVKLGKKDILTKVTINLNEKKVELDALVDTGNSLKEPLTQKPVMIVEYFAIKDILPQKIEKLFTIDGDIQLDTVAEVMFEISDEVKLRIIPFKSLGKSNGMLIGFKPDEISINDKNFDKKVREDVVVGIYNDKLSSDDKYKCLLHPEILY